MRIPDPKANTTTEAYLAYKAGYLEESELKPVLYKPYPHFDGWLAYWAGLVNTYPTKENGDPEMLCDEEALVAYLSGVTDTYPEDIKDPYDVRIVGYLKYLVSARWGRPEYPVNNEEFYLSTMKPPVVPSGDPSSDIEIDDTAEAPFIDLKMYGDTYQQTYSGTNLFNVNAITPPTGVTINADGSITCVYDNTSGSSTRFMNLYTPNLDLQTSTTYAAFAEIMSLSGGGTLAVITGGSSASQFTHNKTFDLADYQSGDIIKTTDETKDDFSGTNVGTRTYVSVQAGLSLSLTFRMSVIADTTVTPENFVYQPYTGGIPAPNPDYPQAVNTVTGRQMVKVEGPNLFYGTNASSGGIVSSWSGSEVTLEGVTTSSYANITGIDPVATLFPAGEYTFSTDTISNDYTKVIRIRENGSNHDYTISKGGSSVTFTATDSFTIRVCFISSLTTGINISDTFGLQLQQGSVATKYCPYGGADYEINLGKNLSPYAIYDANDGRLLNMPDLILPAGTHTISFDLESFELGENTSISIYMSLYNASGTNVTGDKNLLTIDSSTPLQRYSFTFTATDEVHGNSSQIRLTVGAYSANGRCKLSNIQIELGSTATTYAPYFEPIELCELSSVSDAPELLIYQNYIYESEEGWMLHKEIDKTIFDGSSDEDWKAHNQHNGIYAWDWLEVGAAHSNSAILSDLYRPVYITTYNSDSNRGYGMIATLEKTTTSERETVFMTAPNSSITTLVQFRGWLAENPVTAYFASANPTDTLITNNDLIAQLDALKEGGSYEGKTYIKVTATDPNLPGLLYVEAGKYD